MKIPSPQSAFTMFEMLIVLVVIVVLVALIILQFSRRGGAMGISCMSNQKQISLGFIMSQSDNGGKFPWQLSTAANGAMELITNGHASSQFLPLTNYIKSVNVFVCPTDSSKVAATNVETLTDRNISYFVNADAPTNNPSAVLTGDRHLRADGRAVKPGLFVFTNTVVMDWTHELHPVKMFETFGAMSFADGHAQIVNGKDLNAIFVRQVLSGSRLEVP